MNNLQQIYAELSHRKMCGIYKRINAIMKGRKAIIGKFGYMELLKENGPFA